MLQRCDRVAGARLCGEDSDIQAAHSGIQAVHDQTPTEKEESKAAACIALQLPPLPFTLSFTVDDGCEVQPRTAVRRRLEALIATHIFAGGTRLGAQRSKAIVPRCNDTSVRQRPSIQYV